jgi:hypothetical protein
MNDEERLAIGQALEESLQLYRELQSRTRDVRGNAATARARSAEIRQRAGVALGTATAAGVE